MFGGPLRGVATELTGKPARARLILVGRTAGISQECAAILKLVSATVSETGGAWAHRNNHGFDPRVLFEAYLVDALYSRAADLIVGEHNEVGRVSHAPWMHPKGTVAFESAFLEHIRSRLAVASDGSFIAGHGASAFWFHV